MRKLGKRFVREDVVRYFEREKCPAVDGVSELETAGLGAHIKSLMCLGNLSALSLGCGDGRIEKFLLASSRPKSLTCIDISARNLKLARSRLPNAKFIQMDLRNFDTAALEAYDLIFSVALAQYLTDAEILSLHKNLFTVLNPGGKIFHFDVPDSRRKFIYRINNAIVMENWRYFLPSRDFIDDFSNWCDRKSFRAAGYKTTFLTPSYHWERFDAILEKL